MKWNILINTRWKSRGQAKTAAIHCFELNFAIMLVTALKAMKKLTRMMIDRKETKISRTMIDRIETEISKTLVDFKLL